MAKQLDFTHEARTFIEFPSDRDFAAYREELKRQYDPRMVRIAREKVGPTGRTLARLDHASNLGAELRGLAFAAFRGVTR